MERGTDTSRPNRRQERFWRTAEARSAVGANTIMRFPEVEEIVKISEQVSPKRKSLERKWGEATEEGSLLVREMLLRMRGGR
jgi:hypothetical protein